jgi:hypothetical protein
MFWRALDEGLIREIDNIRESNPDEASFYAPLIANQS